MELEWHGETGPVRLPCTNQFTRFSSQLYTFISLSLSLWTKWGQYPGASYPETPAILLITTPRLWSEHATSLHTGGGGRCVSVKHPRFHDISRGGCIPTWWKSQPERRRRSAHNILRINWPVLLTCRNDGNAKVYVYNTNTIRKSNITRVLPPPSIPFLIGIYGCSQGNK